MRAPGPRHLSSILLLIQLLLPLIVISRSCASPILEPQSRGSSGIGIATQDSTIHALLHHPTAFLPNKHPGLGSPDPLLSPRAFTTTTTTNRVTYGGPAGWTVTVAPGLVLMPVSLVARGLSEFYDSVMGYAAARVLANAAPMTVGVDFSEGALMLDFSVMDRAGSRGLEWKVVCWVVAYMQALVGKGYTGLGSMIFRHESGLELEVTLSLEWNVRVTGGV